MKLAMMTLALLSLCGCIRTGTSYLEGTSLQLGAYVPVSGQLYGVEASTNETLIRASTP